MIDYFLYSIGEIVILFVAYIKQEGRIISVICEDIKIHPILEDFLLLTGVKQTMDNTVQNLEILEIAIRLSDLSHYVRGRLQ